MNALKTVERSSKLKLLEKKLAVVTRDLVNGSNELNTINRELDTIANKVNTMTVMREFQTARKKHGALQGAKFDKAEALDSMRDSLMQKRDDLSEMQNVLESELADGLDVADELGEVRNELNKVNSEITVLTSEIDDLVKADKADFDAEVAELTAKQDSLLDNRDVLEQKVADSSKEYNSLKEKIGDLKGNKRFSVKDFAKRGIKGGVALGLNTVKGIAKSGFTKVDPLANSINKNDVNDTGMESVRFARQGVNKTVQGIKTANKTIKTTTRGIKTATRTVKATVKATQRAVTAVAKTVVFVAKVAVKTVTHIVAAAMNPITWVIAGILLVVVILSMAIVMLMGGGSSSNSARVAGGAVGLGDVAGQYTQGVGFRNTAIDNAQAGHNALIDATTTNDLIYMSVTRTDGTVVNYTTAFAQPWQTNFLKAQPWSYPLNENLLPVNDTIAIAYVLLQKRANQANGTTNQIYDVTYTQAIFDEIMALAVVYNSTIYANQYCPGANCRYMPPTDDAAGYYYCSRHNLHAIGVWFYNADTVMNGLGFTGDDKQWVSLTIQGFESNPQITG